jgi:hypothetical protein
LVIGVGNYSLVTSKAAIKQNNHLSFFQAALVRTLPHRVNIQFDHC